MGKVVRVHRTDLTDKMRSRIAQASDAQREAGKGPNDPDRLIDSWPAATPEELGKLEDLLRTDKEYYSVTANVKNKDYETFGVFTNKVLGTKIQNIKTSWRKAAESAKQVQEEQKKGPFDTGVKAKTTSGSASIAPTVKSNANASFNGKHYNKSDGSVVADKQKKGRSAMSVATGVSISAASFNGKAIANDTSAGSKSDTVYPHSLLQAVDCPVGGGAVFGTACTWIDQLRNKRGSLHLCFGSMAVIPEDGVDVRLSSKDASVIVTQVDIDKDCIEPDKALKYLLKRVRESAPHLNNRAARLAYLQNHPRFSALYGNLMKLKIQLGVPEVKVIRFEYRQRFMTDDGKPLYLARELVSKEEDNIFFGLHVEYDKKQCYHLHMEFKEKGKPFGPVDHSGTSRIGSKIGSPGFRAPMSPINEDGTAMDTDDDGTDAPPATINTKVKEAMKRGKKKAGQAHRDATSQDDDDDDSSLSTQESEEDVDMEYDTEEDCSNDDDGDEDVTVTTEAANKLRAQLEEQQKAYKKLQKILDKKCRKKRVKGDDGLSIATEGLSISGKSGLTGMTTIGSPDLNGKRKTTSGSVKSKSSKSKGSAKSVTE